MQQSEESEDAQIFSTIPLCEQKGVSELDLFQTTRLPLPDNILNSFPSFITAETTPETQEEQYTKRS